MIPSSDLLCFFNCSIIHDPWLMLYTAAACSVSPVVVMCRRTAYSDFVGHVITVNKPVSFYCLVMKLNLNTVLQWGKRLEPHSDFMLHN
jgi:hypothetical protein